MNIAKSTYKLLEPIIAAIDVLVRIDSVTVNGGGSYTLSICNTKWITQGFTLTIQGNQFLITSIIPNMSIVVTGIGVPVAGTFNLYLPKFYHGTINAVEVDLNAMVNGNLLTVDKMPMIWLHEPVDEINYPLAENAIARKSKCELYFLIDANFAQWDNDDHYEQAIMPMRQLIMAFEGACKNSIVLNYDLTDEFSTDDLPRFGRYTGYSSKNKAVFAQYEMSGTKLGISLSFVKGEEICCEKSGIDYWEIENEFIIN